MKVVLNENAAVTFVNTKLKVCMGLEWFVSHEPLRGHKKTDPIYSVSFFMISIFY
jgi:hypothetical protein